MIRKVDPDRLAHASHCCYDAPAQSHDLIPEFAPRKAAFVRRAHWDSSADIALLLCRNRGHPTRT
jgi:hypothetical protein